MNVLNPYLLDESESERGVESLSRRALLKSGAGALLGGGAAVRNNFV